MCDSTIITVNICFVCLPLFSSCKFNCNCVHCLVKTVVKSSVTVNIPGGVGEYQRAKLWVP